MADELICLYRYRCSDVKDFVYASMHTPSGTTTGLRKRIKVPLFAPAHYERKAATQTYSPKTSISINNQQPIKMIGFVDKVKASVICRQYNNFLISYKILRESSLLVKSASFSDLPWVRSWESAVFERDAGQPAHESY